MKKLLLATVFALASFSISGFASNFQIKRKLTNVPKNLVYAENESLKTYLIQSSSYIEMDCDKAFDKVRETVLPPSDYDSLIIQGSMECSYVDKFFSVSVMAEAARVEDIPHLKSYLERVEKFRLERLKIEPKPVSSFVVSVDLKGGLLAVDSSVYDSFEPVASSQWKKMVRTWGEYENYISDFPIDDENKFLDTIKDTLGSRHFRYWREGLPNINILTLDSNAILVMEDDSAVESEFASGALFDCRKDDRPDARCFQ